MILTLQLLWMCDTVTLMSELPIKVQNTVEMIEGFQNTVEVSETESEYGTHYWITFNSIQDHFLLESQGTVSFYKSQRSGRTRFGGGTLYPAMGKIQKFKTYQDMRITIHVYTSQRERV